MTGDSVARAMKLFASTQPPPQFVAEVEQESHMRVALLFGRSLGHWIYGEPLSVRMEGVCKSPLGFPMGAGDHWRALPGENTSPWAS